MLLPSQDDPTPAILAQISIQLGSLSVGPSFINSTQPAFNLSALQEPFRPSLHAVLLNVLWFISLVLSLAAALFGIRAKQWCREYLRWHSVVDSARLNILLRQLRYEAWERWKVGSYISAVPVLLEIALILFFVRYRIPLIIFYISSVVAWGFDCLI